MAGPLYTEQLLTALAAGLAAALPEWGLPLGCPLSRINVSENVTFRADPPGAPALVLRVLRPGYHSDAEVASELAWISALRAGGVVATPAPVPPRTGDGTVRFSAAGRDWRAIAFAHVPGAPPAADAEGFLRLGAITAQLHAHAAAWVPPRGFGRKRWGIAETIGPAAPWGPWQAALGLDRRGHTVVSRAVARLTDRLGAYGTTPDRFGLIHADLRHANLLADGATLWVIDFDDCGFGWSGFDFAAAVSFLEDHPDLPNWRAAWLEGYARVSALPPGLDDHLSDFVMLRRLQLTAWIASHAEVPEAAALGAGYTDGTVALAETYLTGASGTTSTL